MSKSQVQLAIEKIRAENEARRAALGFDYSPPEDRPMCSCGVEMVKHPFGDDYWCPGCEITATALAAQRRSTKADNRANREARQERIMAANDLHPIYGYIRRLTRHLMAGVGLECGRVIFRNRNKSSHHAVEKADHSIEHRFTYGFYGIDYWTENGFRDKKSWDWLWQAHRPGLTGKKAAWALVIHEVAHAIQVANHGRHYGSMHNQVWATAVQRLQREFPYQEVKAI